MVMRSSYKLYTVLCNLHGYSRKPKGKEHENRKTHPTSQKLKPFQTLQLTNN